MVLVLPLLFQEIILVAGNWELVANMKAKALYLLHN